MEKILDNAEREFAVRGYVATPLWRIAAAAKVNQALINYYFGSKERLYLAIFMRRGLELAEERLRHLTELESTKGPLLGIEDLVRGFLLPVIRMLYRERDGRDFIRLQARLHNEPTEITTKLRAVVYDKATRAYIDKFKVALPDVDPGAMVWRMTMMIGAYLYVISDPNRLEQLSNGQCDAKDPDELVRQLTAFFTGGFMAPMERRDERSTAMVA
jgi:AcrR family transcriptional regulator